MTSERAGIYRLLSLVFQRPEPGMLRPALQSAPRSGVGGAVQHLVDRLQQIEVAELQRTYDAVFGPSVGSSCSPNETAHASETPQEALTHTFQLADIAGFYRAFGVKISPETERPDHIAVELEFMHLLAVKELYAEERGERARAEICRDAAHRFLDDHLLRWSPKLRARLEECAGDTVYGTAAVALDEFLELDASRLGEAAA